MRELPTCRQCFADYEPIGRDDGFCGDTCMKEYDHQIGCKGNCERCGTYLPPEVVEEAKVMAALKGNTKPRRKPRQLQARKASAKALVARLGRRSPAPRK